MTNRPCHRCDAELQEGAAFCISCGSPVGEGAGELAHRTTEDDEASEAHSPMPAAEQATPATRQPEGYESSPGEAHVPSQSSVLRAWRSTVPRTVEILAALVSALAIAIGAINYVAEADDRRQQTVDEAWQVISAAEGQPTDGGRSAALEFLNGGDPTIPNKILKVPIGAFLGEENQTSLSKDGQSLIGVNVEGAFLEDLDLEDAMLNYANFQETHLDGAKFRSADLWRANFRGAYLSTAYDNKGKPERKANLDAALVEEADLRDAVLKQASLRKAKLSLANLHSAWLNKADLREAELDGALLKQASLRGADLRDASMDNTYLEDADLRGADLRGAKNLYAEQLQGTIGDEDTLLPGWVQRPSLWKYGTEIPLNRELKSQEYSSRAFAPTMRFTVGAHWYAISDWPDETALYYDSYYDTRPIDYQLSFTNVQQVFDQSNPTYNLQRPSLANVSPPPDDIVGWLQNHPYLHVGKPVQKSIDGVPAVQLDVAVDSLPPHYPSNCPRPCVPLFLDSQGEWWSVYEGYESKMLIPDIEGEALVFAIEAPVEDSDVFFPKAQKVIDSVRWVDTLEVPDLSGESLEEAKNRVGQDLELTPSYRHSGEQQGLVLSQKLLPGNTVSQGSDLPLTVSQGPEPGITFHTVSDESGMLIEVGADESWTHEIDQRESKPEILVTSPDGSMNVIVSSEPIDPSYDARGYTDEQWELEKKELHGIQRSTYEVRNTFGVTGFEQTYEWDPKNGEPVTQIQYFYAEEGRGYVATATARSADFKELEPQLRDVLDKTTLIR